MSKTITIIDIARKLCMSPSTVSKALNDHPSISTMTKERVRSKALELNYVPNEAARFFQQKKTKQIGVIIPGLRDQFYAETISGIEAAAMQRNYKVLLCLSHESVEKERELANMMLLQRVDALIITITKHTCAYDHIQQLEKLQIPVLYFVRSPKLEKCNYTKNNVFEAAEAATSFLIGKGHRHIAHLKGPDDLTTSNERLDGYKSALQAAGLAVEDAFIQTTNLSESSTVSAFKKILNAPIMPTAVLAFNDYVALDAIEYLKREAPHLLPQIGFVGYGNTPALRYMNYPLTASVEELPYQLGEKAIACVLQLMNQEPAQPSLQVNESCKLQVFRRVSS